MSSLNAISSGSQHVGPHDGRGKALGRPAGTSDGPDFAGRMSRARAPR